MRYIRLFLLCCFSVSVFAATPTLTVSADTLTAEVGDEIVLTVGVQDAPAFASWNATNELTDAFTTIDQAAGDLATFVPDSRSDLDGGPRFGGFAFANHAPGNHVLARITIRAETAGTYTLTLPAYDSDEAPFGGLLIALDGTEYVAQGTSLTLTITGDGTPPVDPQPVRRLALKTVPGYSWHAVDPSDASDGGVQGDDRIITLDPTQDALLDLLPAANN